MTAKGLLPKEEREVARLYQQTNADGSKKFTQDELASRFFVAPVTIRRALAEHGLIELKAYKTRKDESMLKLLNSKGISTLNDLENLFDDIRQINKVMDKHDIEDPKGLDWALSGSQP